MWDVILALLVLSLSTLWWVASKLRRPPVTDDEERVKFLLSLLIESRWIGLTYKLLYRHRHHHRGLTSVDDRLEVDYATLAVDHATAASDVAQLSEIPATAVIPRCPRCNQLMLMRRNRRNHGLFWGCVTYPVCRGTRRPGDTGDDQ